MPDEAKNSTTIPLKRVTLYKHGVGYFERRGRFQGPGEIELMCGPEVIDDMLKSLLVLNLDGGKLAAVTYESAKTLPARLSEFGFDLRKCKGMLELIVQLKGAPVTITAGTAKFEGRVIGLDEVEQVVGDSKVKEHQLVLYTGGSSFRRISLASIDDIVLNDPALAGEIQQQLELLFQSIRKKDRKLLKVELLEKVEREVVIAYSVACPIWKTSYRLVLDDRGRLLIQGMAIVDNVQDEDWNDVEIALISAAPVSFIQPLYDPVQPYRRTVLPQGVTSSGPFVAERSQSLADSAVERFAQLKAAQQAAGGAAGQGQPAPAQARRQGATPSGDWAEASFGQVQAVSGEHASVDLFNQLQWQEPNIEPQETGELLEYRIKTPVTVPRNSSALIPIVNQIIDGERLSLYNAGRHAKFPYAAVRLKNTTGLTLEGGPVTIMENDSYAGEAMLDVLKNEDTRILPFALDQGISVLVRDRYERRPVWRVRAWQGYLYMDYKEENQKIYNLESLSDKDKVVYVEHPVNESLALVGREKPIEVTSSYYRFKVDLKARTTYALVVGEEWQGYQTVRLEDFDSPELQDVNWLLGQNFADRKFAVFLKEVVARRQEIKNLFEARRRFQDQVMQYKAEQERARENVRTLGSMSDRYRRAIDEAEDKINEAVASINEFTQKITELRQEYSTFINQSMQSDVLAAIES